MNRIIYLHGFASGPNSSKARYFRSKLQQTGAFVDVPALDNGDFEHLTITSQLSIIDRAAGAHPVSLMGSSMGGYLAALYASRHPQVQRVVLLAPAFGFVQRWPERLGPAAIDAWRRIRMIDVFHYAQGRTCKLDYQLLVDGARYEAYPEFSQPALIFHGMHDATVPVDYSKEFASTHPNVTLEVLDSGHDLLNVLDYMAPKIVAFLSA